MPENDFLRCQKNAVNLFCHLEVETMVLNLVFFFFTQRSKLFTKDVSSTCSYEVGIKITRKPKISRDLYSLSSLPTETLVRDWIRRRPTNARRLKTSHSPSKDFSIDSDSRFGPREQPSFHGIVSDLDVDLENTSLMKRTIETITF